MSKVLRRMLVVFAASLGVGTAWADTLPSIRDRQLLVDGKPYLAIGGELHNSSTSSPAYMEPVWEKLQKMHVRTVVSTVSWEDLEPEEGTFDYTTLDAQIEQARQRDMRLVLIWFGAFKNAGSTYAPSWVRRDTARFPRALEPREIADLRTAHLLVLAQYSSRIPARRPAALCKLSMAHFPCSLLGPALKCYK